jgi:hypothetical protein
LLTARDCTANTQRFSLAPRTKDKQVQREA